MHCDREEFSIRTLRGTNTKSSAQNWSICTQRWLVPGPICTSLTKMRTSGNLCSDTSNVVTLSSWRRTLSAEQQTAKLQVLFLLSYWNFTYLYNIQIVFPFCLNRVWIMRAYVMITVSSRFICRHELTNFYWAWLSLKVIGVSERQQPLVVLFSVDSLIDRMQTRHGYTVNGRDSADTKHLSWHACIYRS